jgi:hypothetical protein
MNSPISAARYAASFTFVVALTACGGVGDGTTPATPPTDGGSVTGLIPAASAPGPVLYQDAGTLRPLQGGTVWTYSGTATGTTGGQSPSYTNTVTQQAAAGGVSESATNIFETGTDTATITVDAAGVHTTENVNLFGGSTTGPLSDLELRSPVRQNDQIKLLDQQQVDMGEDLDGDGVNDKADIAAYRVVVGNESVTLPNLPPVTALRVDVTIALRAYVSSTGAATPVLTFVESIWYEPGVGIVRQKLIAPTATATNEVYDEVLTRWDGVSHGLGVMAMQKAILPASAGSAAGLWSAGAIAALTFGDHSVVQTGFPESANTSGTSGFGAYFDVLDMRGNVTSFAAYDSLTSLHLAKMVPTSQGFALVSPVNASGQGTLATFDAQAKLLAPTTGIGYDLTTPGLIQEYERGSAIGGDATGWWIVWQRSYVIVGVRVVYEVAARKFDYAGHALTNALVLGELDSANSAGEFAVAASNGTALISWKTQDGPTQYVRMSGNPTAAPAAQTFGSSGDDILVDPLVTSTAGGFALTWNSPANPGSALSAFGVLLGTDGLPVFRSGSPGPAGEALGGQWPAGTLGATWGADKAGGGLVAAGATFVESTNAEPTGYYVATWKAPSGALSSATPQFTTFPGVADIFLGSSPTVIPLVFPDRVIVLTSGNEVDALATTLVWRQ